MLGDSLMGPSILCCFERQPLKPCAGELPLRQRRRQQKEYDGHDNPASSYGAEEEYIWKESEDDTIPTWFEFNDLDHYESVEIVISDFSGEKRDRWTDASVKPSQNSSFSDGCCREGSPVSFGSFSFSSNVAVPGGACLSFRSSSSSSSSHPSRVGSSLSFRSNSHGSSLSSQSARSDSSESPPSVQTTVSGCTRRVRFRENANKYYKGSMASFARNDEPTAQWTALVDRYWYSTEEYDNFRRQHRKACRRVSKLCHHRGGDRVALRIKQHLEIAMNTTHSLSSSSSSTNNGVYTGSTSPLESYMQNNPPSRPSDCYYEQSQPYGSTEMLVAHVVGLEHALSQLLTSDRQKRRTRVLRAVLDAQSFFDQAIHTDPVTAAGAIRNASLEVSIRSVATALAIARLSVPAGSGLALVLLPNTAAPPIPTTIISNNAETATTTTMSVTRPVTPPGNWEERDRSYGSQSTEDEDHQQQLCVGEWRF